MKVTLLILTLLLPGLATAEYLTNITYPDVTVSEITSIYDGDTFRANIDSYPKIAGYRMSIRINGIDTPEIRAKCTKEKILARKAKEFTVTALRSGQTIELKNIKRGKYFRLLADVYVGGESLGKDLILNGLAIEYHGKTKRDWCK